MQAARSPLSVKNENAISSQVGNMSLKVNKENTVRELVYMQTLGS